MGKDATISKASAAHTNSGTINVSGGTFTIGGLLESADFRSYTPLLADGREKVFIFDIMRPWSCHFFPISPPPRMCAVARINPRSSSEKSLELKVSSVGYPYDP